MELEEWIAFGTKNGIVDASPVQEVTFAEAYKKWFLMKLKVIRSQSCDRIECTWNKYYAASSFSEKNLSRIDETVIVDYLTFLIVGRGGVTFKEFRRIYQIVNNVMVYAKDMKLGGARLLDWDIVKRYIPEGKFVPAAHQYFAVPKSDVQKMMHLVTDKKIYALKQSACLCLMLNFYLGLRVGELASLAWQDVDYAAGVIRVHRTEVKAHCRDDSGNRCGVMSYRVVEEMKTEYSVREIPLLPEAYFLLEKLRRHHQSCGYDSRYLAYDGSSCVLIRSLDRTLRRLCDLCEVNRFSTHEIRKTFATMLHMSGVPTRHISDLLGHSDMLTTERSYILNYRDNHEILLEYMKKGLKF